MHGYVSGVVDSLKIGNGVGGSVILEDWVPTKAERLAGNAMTGASTKFVFPNLASPLQKKTNVSLCRTAPKVIEISADQVNHLL